MKSDESDNRINRVYLTDSGREVFEKAEIVKFSIVKDLFGILDDNECTKFVSLMQKVVEEQRKNCGDC